MKSKSGGWHPYLLVVSVGVVCGYMLIGTLIYDSLSHVQSQCGGPVMQGRTSFTPDDYEAQYLDTAIHAAPHFVHEYLTISFPAREDGVAISAWWLPVHIDAPTIIVVHGLRVCRRDPTVLLTAGLLHERGFNVILLDLRNHGASQVTDGRTTAGILEQRDVLGAVDWLVAQDYEQIGVVGMSLGGAAALKAFAHEPRIDALWLDSSFVDLPAVLYHELERHQVPTFLATPATQMGQLLTGINLQQPLPQLETNRPIMIVHGMADTRIPFAFGQQLAATFPHAQTWFVPDADHVQTVYLYPEMYQERLFSFFDMLNSDCSINANLLAPAAGAIACSIYPDSPDTLVLTRRLTGLAPYLPHAGYITLQIYVDGVLDEERFIWFEDWEGDEWHIENLHGTVYIEYVAGARVYAITVGQG